MKVLKNLSLMVLLALAFAGCRGKSSQLADFNKQLYAPEYASGFKIERADGRQSVLVSVMNPWQGADSVTTRLFISRNGEPVPEGFDGQVLEGDAQRIVAMSSTHIAMLDAIGETARVVGVSGLDYISNPDIQARRDSIGDVGYEGNINYELLLSLDPDLVLLFGVNGASAMESKLKELGIPFMYVGDYLEESPLGKAEWLVALSEVVGKRAKGEKVFADIPIRYNALKQKVSGAVLDAPSVMLNTPYGDSWFHALDGKLCRAADYRRRRRLHLQEEHGQLFDAYRLGGGIPARFGGRYVAERRHGEHTRRTESRLPEVRRYPLRPKRLCL